MIEFINIDNYEDFERASDYAREMNKPIFVEAGGHELVLMTAELFEEMFGELYADMEKIEVVLDDEDDEYLEEDRKLAEEAYAEYLASGCKSTPIEEFWKELGLDDDE